LENAIDNALTQGRGGKGCVVVFASGNDDFHNRVGYPGSYHNDILVVGGIKRTGHRWDGSNHGDRLDVVAPGFEILSTMNGGMAGYMNGTSQAAPHVSGIAALILSVRPDLTAQEVKRVIELTAKRINPPSQQIYTYANHPNRPNGDWNNEMGYGLVDAYAAVSAVTLEIQSHSNGLICATPQTFSLTTGNLQIPDPVATWSFDNPSGFAFDSPNQSSTWVRIKTTATNGQSTMLRAKIGDFEVASQPIWACNIQQPDTPQPPIPNIFGIEFICGESADYQIFDLPLGTNITWSAINLSCKNNICTTNSSANDGLITMSRNPNFVGAAYISATFMLNNTSTTIYKTVFVNRPFTTASIVAPNTIGVGLSANISVEYTAYAPLTLHTWDIDPSAILSFQKNNLITTQFSHTGNYTITATVSNACSPQTVIATRTIQVVDFTPPAGSCNFCPPPHVPECPNCLDISVPICFCLGVGCSICDLEIWSYFPNPATDELTISFSEHFGQTERSENYSIKLLDASGKIQRESKFNHRKRDGRAKPVKFDTSKLKEGTYYLHVEGGGKTEKVQIVVKR
jgi:hypothetical protein